MHLNTSYASSAILNGPIEHTDIILGGLTIPKQIISAVSFATADAPKGNAGALLGLAYPALTSAFPRTNPAKDVRCKGKSSCGPIPYSPLITSQFKGNAIEPVFSFATSQKSNFGCFMTIYGIPKLDNAFVNAMGNIATTSPIKPLGNTIVFSAYIIEVDGFVYDNAAENSGQGLYVVNTGTMPNLFPKEQADAINALFSPSATFNSTYGGYLVSWNAEAPELGVSIGGMTFYHDPKDMILAYEAVCLSAI